MIARVFVLVALGLVLNLPVAAGAQASPGSTTDALTAVTRAYFDAMGEADFTALARTTAPAFHMIGTDGKRMDPGEYLGRMYARHLNASTPRQTLRIATPAISGTTATEAVSYASFDYRILDGEQWLERDFSDHQLTFTQNATGAWLVDEDHITSANRY